MADPALDETVSDNTGTIIEAPAPSPRAATRLPTSNKVTVNGRFDIDTTRSVIEFEHDFADAYECTSLDTGLADHVALVIKNRYPVRQDIITACINADIPGLIFMRAATTVDWPRDDTHRFVLIYRRPGGNAVFPKHTQRREPLSEDILRNGLIRPIFYALRNFADRGMYHGNVRPDNIFMTTHDNAEAMLGECASSIPGINQSAAFETIERGMADRHAKGKGAVLDDIYSFGAMVAVLLRGSNPLEGKSDTVIVEEKVIRGSFAVFTDGLRLSPGVSEFLRATLNDDPKQRWNIDQVNAWVDGSRTTPKQTAIAQRAQRAIDFNGKKYVRPRMLARDLTDNIHEAVTLIESGHVTKWVERAMSDPETAELISAAISRAAVGGRTAGFEDRLVCFVSMALDPSAPIRYKGLRVFPAGIGYSMAYTLINELKIQTYGEIIRDRYAWVWLAYKENAAFESLNDLQQHFDLASKYIVRRGIDYGLERTFYELCPQSPCLSDMLKRHYAINPGLVLEGLNESASSFKEAKPMDRHIAAFITTHDARDNAGLMSLLETGDPIRKSLALITLLQNIQKRYDNPKLPHLCEWLIKDAEIVAQRFHSQNLKQEIIRQIPKEVKTGNLNRLMGLIDNPLQVKKDEYDFVQSGKAYMLFGREKDSIRKSLESDPEFGLASGRHIALMIAVILSGIMIASTVMMNFSGFSGGGY